jgi:hypothetical protein
MNYKLPDGKFQVRILRTLVELEELRGFWSTLACDPESDLDFINFIINSRPEIMYPYVLVVSQDSQPVALVAGRIERAHFEVKAGYKVLWRIPIRRLTIFYGGFMGQTSPEITEVVVRQLLQSLREEKADLLLWSGVQTGTDLHRLLTRIPSRLCRDHLAQPVPRWRMTLPSSLDELLEQRMNKKHRYWAKRLFRQLEKDFPDPVRLACFSKAGETDRFFNDVIQVARKTYQWGLGVGFLDDVEHKERLRLEAANGWHRGYVLYLNGQPAAFWICIVHQGTVYSAFTGYDPQYRKYELGTVLFLRMIGELTREHLKLLDFGPGTALYKERFGDSQFAEATFRTFAGTGRGICFNALRMATELPVQTVRELLRRFGIEQKVKKAWRRLATPRRPLAEAAEPQA